MKLIKKSEPRLQDWTNNANIKNLSMSRLYSFHTLLVYSDTKLSFSLVSLNFIKQRLLYLTFYFLKWCVPKYHFYKLWPLYECLYNILNFFNRCSINPSQRVLFLNWYSMKTTRCLPGSRSTGISPSLLF